MENIEPNKSSVSIGLAKANIELDKSGSVDLTKVNIEQNRPLALGNLLKQNTIWLIFLALGGGILAFYYAQIGYLPDIEWSSSIVYLGVAFLIGGVVGLLLALSLLIPGYIWSEFLIFDEKLRYIFCYDPVTKEVCVRTLSWQIGLPFGVVLLVNHIALLLFPTFLSTAQMESSVLLVVYAFVSAILLLAVSVFMLPRFKLMLKESCTIAEAKLKPEAALDSKPTAEPSSVPDPLTEERNRKRNRKRRVFKYVGWFALSVLLSQVSMILIYLLSGRPEGKSYFITTIFCTLGVLISNHVVAVHYRRNWVHAVAASLVVASLLLFLADRNASLSSQIMARYGLGPNSTVVDLLISEEGVKIMDQLKLQDENCAQPSSGRRICRVLILSRLGDEYYLQLNRGDKTFRFTLPKQIVSSRVPSPCSDVFQKCELRVGPP